MQIRLLPETEEPLKALAAKNRRTPTAEVHIAIEKHLAENRAALKSGAKLPKR